ncbi:phenolphthiocerol/phthiocerol polyketide synthase subunit C-like [Babylonia areolata]|uniref:phenolphthiocerol/phthiocerol polyketide synthase subunit C-like n=1 Tax=Babylonia areolata TaxID=304850 RepID=UPI003FD3799B
MAEQTEDAIAIVGIGCKVPGADNIRDFWRVLLHGENHVTEIPPSRWNADAFYDPEPMAAGKGYVKRAGLVNEPEEFDNRVYGINDFEAAQMDPQQRFILDCTLMALEDAGLTRAQIAGSNMGVFIGVSNSDYRVLFRASSSSVGSYTVTGISNSIIAARVSYVFDLRGPSLVLDTACSSSLIGMHLACQAIRAGDCNMAIAGGTNFLTLPDVFVHLCKAGMMSRAGQCHAFGSKADGYIRGEGCGVVILKPLKDAERDGDNIWATLYTGTNQDGHTVSPLTAPSGIQQQSLLHSVSSQIGLDLERVDYIEAHGTGTRAGDPVEASSLGQFFQSQASSKQRYLGSVKTNIGHLESAAGVVGVIKVLLMMKHNVIVPSLHCEEPNPLIDFKELKLVVPGEPVDWENPDKVACCNSFGFGGSNSHAVLCQYKKKEQENSASALSLTTQRPCIVALSACTEKSLRGVVVEVLGDPELHALNVHDLSLTSTARRDHYPVRLAHVVEDLSELTAALEEDLARPVLGSAVYRQPTVTFVFGGMGTCWPGMCTQLMEHLPVFRDTVMQIEEELKKYVDWSLSERLHEDFDPQDPLFSPIAIFACQVALAAVWRDLGLEPQSIVGQSVGEVGAAHVAGCISQAEAVKIVYHRSRLLATVTGGKMIIVRHVPVAETKKVVSRYGDKACISLFYSPTSCCISVNHDTAEELRVDLTSSLHADHKGMLVSQLHVPVAYHSAHVDSCKAPLAAALNDLRPQPPAVPLLSSVTGLRLNAAPDVDYWVDNLRQPVLFDQAVRQSREAPSRQLFVEIGPKPVLRAHLSDIFPKADVTCVASMSRPPEFKVFLQAVTAMYEFGSDLTWNRLPTWGTQLTDLPRYVFDKKKNLEKSETAAIWLSGVDESQLTHPFVFPLSNTTAGFKLVVSCQVLKSVSDHVVKGRILVPGAVFAETGFAVAKFLNSCGDRRWSVSVDLDKDVIYNALRHAGFMYGETFTQLDDATVNDKECLCTLRVHPTVLSEIPGTTIHPAVLDGMLQSSLLITGKAGSKVGGELLPKALGRLLVHRPLDTIMVVYTKLKAKGVKQMFYDLKLLTCSGAVIAELDGLVINMITEENEHSLEHMYITRWSHVTPLPTPGGLEDEEKGEGKGMVFLTDYVIEDGEDVGVGGKVEVMDVEGMDFTHGLPSSVQQLLTSHKTAAALVLLCLTRLHDSADADAVDSHIVNLSFLYKEVLSLANRLSLSLPIYLCTCSAWPSPSPGHHDAPVNPTATERIYPDTLCVDLQLPTDTLTLSSLATVFSCLLTHPDLQSHAELLVNPDGVYVNQICHVDSSTSLPMFRANSLSPKEPAILISKEASAVVTPNAVLRDVTSSSGRREAQEVTHLQAQAFALQSPSLLNLKVDTPAVTILASSSTQHYADALQEFFRGRRNGKVPYVITVVMVDQLHVLRTSLDETVISLVLLDGNLVSSLIACWNKAKTLITCSSLLQSDALTCACYFAEDVDLVVVDTQLLFHPSALKRQVPRVGEWLRERSRAMSSIMTYLHHDVSSASPAQVEHKESGAVLDMADLLRFQTSQMTSLQVQVSKDQLFRKDGVYLVVGGLSGLGWICVEYLAEKHAGHIAILNRRSPSQQQLNNMAALSARHQCHVTAFQGDVTSLHSLTAVFKQMEEAFPGVALKGIFFGAAVTADRSFLSMDVPGFDSALSPKVRGTWNLHTLTQNLNLDYFVMHSSIASVVGNAGQANYAAGNAFMDGLAHYRRQLGLAAQSINWGVLDIGILSGNDTAREMLESRGFLLMSVEEIQNVLTPILMLNWAQCVPVKLDKQRLSQRMHREGSARIISRMKPILTYTAQQAEDDLLQVVQTAKNCGPEERMAIYERYVQILVSQVLGVELSSVTQEISLLELGIDSVGAMTIITHIHRDTSKRLSAVELLTGHPTVLSVAEAINDAPEEDTAETEEEGSTPKIQEITEEDDSSSEVSAFESQLLKLYSTHPQPERLHIVVDTTLQKHQADWSDLQTAMNTVMALYPSARMTFTEVKGSSGVTFRRSLLPPYHGGDLRVIKGDLPSGESVDAQSCEKLDLQQLGPVRFILTEYPRPALRLVLHKIVFNRLNATQFAEDVRRCLESPGSMTIARVPQAPEPVSPQLEWTRKLEKMSGQVGTDVLNYWATKLSAVNVGSTSLTSGKSHHGVSETDSVKVTVSPNVVRRVKTFMMVHDITLFGVVTSCYQMLLHTLTGQRTIPVLFPLDLRRLHDDVSKDTANYCSELPLLADLGTDGTGRTLQSFVLANNHSILTDIQHGEVPLSLMDPLSDTLSSVLASTVHGTTIDQISGPETTTTDNGLHSAEAVSAKKFKSKQALSFTAADEAVVLPLDLETNLTVRHLLCHNTLTFTLTFKKSALDQWKAHVLLSELVYTIQRLLSKSHTSLGKMARRGSIIKRRLRKQMKIAEC